VMIMQVRRTARIISIAYMVQVVVYRDDLPASRRKHPIEADQLSPVTLRLLVLPRPPRSGKCIQRSHRRTIGGEDKGHDAKVIILSSGWHQVG
jgi:hypothetical protein